ncbi:signal transduction histidine kinase [Mesorhizobium sp. RMAD-H1]|nr:signal transduction histidine kinase [Mesorhizobium sp. RMAD-H1]
MLRFIPTWRSLALRVVTLSTIWVIIALVVVATVISALYREASERSFQRLLSAHLFSLVGAVSVSPDGELQGRPELGEIRYSSPLSGWYWSVEPVSDNLKGRLESPSLAGRTIPQMPLSKVPFDQSFTRTYTEKGLKGEELSVVETEVVLDAANRVARFRVMGNLSEVKKEIRDFRNTLYTYLGIFGLGSILINAAIILFGLRPLDRVRASLANIREGRSARVDGALPTEIAPLAQEMNALIENNRRIVERSRTQVGNLAHSLKTPLSVLVNEGRSIGGEKGRVVVEQSQAMQVQVQHYLQRARIAAQRDSVVFRTPVVPVLERMIRVTAKLNPSYKISFDNNLPNAVFAGEREDFEEIVGNLMENAAKWGRSIIKVSLAPARFEGKADMPPHAGFEVSIEDNGPGLAPEKIKEALMRGHRLDETKPGTGLGLSIVQDTVREYGGTLRLEKSPLGGLAARIVLPLVEN